MADTLTINTPGNIWDGITSPTAVLRIEGTQPVPLPETQTIPPFTTEPFILHIGE